MKRMSRSVRYCCFAIPGVIVGVTGMGLGVLLASGDIGWEGALYYSIAGIIGAPLATLAWGTNKPRRAQSFSGVALLAGILGTLAILLEFTMQHSTIAGAFARAPFPCASWLGIWILWISVALLKLVWFQPEYTRREALPH